MSLEQVFNRAEQNELEQIFNQLLKNIIETVIPEDKIKQKLKDLHNKLPQDKLISLYQTALEQYYCNYIIEIDFGLAQQFGEYILKEANLTRKQGEIAIEKILSNYCNDFFRSHLLFSLFIDFERKHLNIAANEKEKNIVQNQIFNIFHRVFKIPISNLREFWQQYEKLQNNDQEKQKQIIIFNKTILQHDDLGAFERRFRQAILKNDKQQIQEQIDQISILLQQKKIDVNKAINYFNIALFSDSSEIELICELYWQFAQVNTNTNDQKKILGRIIKLRQPTYLLYQKYLRLLEVIQNDRQKNQPDFEQLNVDINETQQTFSRFASQLKSQEDKFNLQLSYIQYLSRSYLSQLNQIENEQKIQFQQLIRDQFQQLQNKQLQNSFKGQAYIVQAKVENQLFDKKDDAIKYFEKGLQLFSKEAQNWRDYIICINQSAFQSRQDRDKIRQIYKKAFENAKDDKISLLQDWLSFEQLFGDIVELEKVEQRQQKLLLNSEGQQSQEEEEVDQEDEVEDNDQEQQNEEEDKEVPQKDKKEEFKLYVDSQKTIFVKNLPLDYTQDNVISLLGPKSGVLECRIVLNKKQESKGFAYIDFEDEDSAQKGAALLNQKVIQGKVLVAQQSKPPKVYNNDEVTLYVSNLPFKLDEEKLKEEFLHLKEVRIIKNEKGESRGYGYLEFEDEKSMDLAFSKLKGNPYIQGRKVFVQYCKSLDKMKEQQSLNVVVMKNLPFKTRESDIKQLFDGMTITEIAIPKEKDGRPRGFAFVEFDNKKDFKTALSMDGIEYKSRKLTILKSDRKLTHQQQDTQEVLNTNSDFKKLFNI